MRLLVFDRLSFGDKTGFSTTGGLPVPNIRKAGSINGLSVVLIGSSADIARCQSNQP